MSGMIFSWILPLGMNQKFTLNLEDQKQFREYCLLKVKKFKTIPLENAGYNFLAREGCYLDTVLSIMVRKLDWQTITTEFESH